MGGQRYDALADPAFRGWAPHRHRAGFWDDQGRPAPWPNDIEQWQPTTNALTAREPQDQPF